MDTNELIAHLSSQAAPTRVSKSPWHMALVWLVGFTIYVALAVLASGLRVDILAQLKTPLFALEIALLVALVVSCAVSAAVLSFPDRYQARRAAQMPLAFFALFAAIILFALITQAVPVELAIKHCECTLFMTFYALLPAAALFYSMRRAASTSPAAASCVAVLTAFAIGALILRLEEQTDSVSHVVMYHYLPMLAAALLGLMVGRKLLRW